MARYLLFPAPPRRLARLRGRRGKPRAGARRAPLLAVALLAAALAAAGCGTGPEAAAPAAAPVADPAAPAAAAGQPLEDLGDGFLVWESNRSGAWRLWTRALDGSPPRRLTKEERGRIQCCPHISPDGSRVAYLSLEPGQTGYTLEGGLGELRLIGRDGGAERTVAPAARTYFENRAVVWRSAAELIYIDADKHTVSLDVDSGESRRLTSRPGSERGRLIDARLRWAADGLVGFWAYDESRREVVERTPRGGCQFYFSHDGRWGYWVAGAGGPIRGADLASGAAVTVLRKNDPRLPAGLGYLYFPMLSADGNLLAFAASPNQHSHDKSDYEIFVAETDPRTLEVRGTPVRFTHHPRTDRFPDVFLEPLPLGRHAGEAPYRVRLEPGDPGSWSWEWGDGARSDGEVGEHRYESPGRYRVVARAGGRELRGQVAVAPARPPTPVAVSARRGGEELLVRFDEPIAVTGARLELLSGLAVAGFEVDEGGRTLRVRPAARLEAADTLRLTGVTDRAQRPNALEPTELEVAPPRWPADPEGLQLLWATADAANLLFDPELGADRAVTLEARGAARLGHDFAMVPAGGHFRAPDELAHRLRWASQATNELTLEATLAPGASRAGAIVSMAGAVRVLRLAERGGRLVFGTRLGHEGPQAFQEVELFALPPGRRSHVVVSYTPGLLAAYLDGELVVESGALQGGFFHWRGEPLAFGADPSGAHPWDGRLEGVAIYNRLLSASEVAENHLRYRELLARRPPVPRWVVEATLEACPEPPSLAQINPYREALSVCRYRVHRVVEGELEAGAVRAARWSVLDGESVAEPAGRVTLALERFEDNPQLASVYVEDTLPAEAGQTLFYVAAAPNRP